jgi:muramoyltetrapeptide carboxypeptidase
MKNEDFGIFLKKGDEIRIVAPAKKILKSEVEKAVVFLEENGFKVSFGKNTFGAFHQFSGTDEERTEDFQEALKDDNVKAIWCARGGYGSIRIIDKIKWTEYLQSPKLIIGFSDITVFHCELQAFDIPSIHSPMPINFETGITEKAKKYFLNIITGNLNPLLIPRHPLNQNGIVVGEIIGGNLSILYSLLGSYTFPCVNNYILFIEDLDEYLYHLDRMMNSLKRSDMKGIKAVIVGSFTNMKDNLVPFGKNAEEIIFEHFKSYNIPICFGFPAGHIENSHAIVFGKQARLEVNEDFSELKYL